MPIPGEAKATYSTQLVDDELGMALHNRATCGHQLTFEEQLQLDAWYEAMDRLEREDLNLNRPSRLETQIDAVLKTNEMIVQDNDKLRKEIAFLEAQLAQQSVL